MVMELCSRGSLHSILRQKDSPDFTFDWARGLSSMKDACLGLQVLHNHTPRLFHRDIKSLNLLVTHDWRVKVSDYGLSRPDVDESEETMKQLRGTMSFAAPEIFHGTKFSAASDIFSMIIVLWEVAHRICHGSYEMPYEDHKQLKFDFQIYLAVAKKGLRPTMPRKCPAPIVDLLQRGWDADPTKRPSLPALLAEIDAMKASLTTDPSVWTVRHSTKHSHHRHKS